MKEEVVNKYIFAEPKRPRLEGHRDKELMFWGTLLLFIFVPLGLFMMYLAENKDMSFHVFEITVVVVGVIGGVFNIIVGSGVIKL